LKICHSNGIVNKNNLPISLMTDTSPKQEALLESDQIKQLQLEIENLKAERDKALAEAEESRRHLSEKVGECVKLQADVAALKKQPGVKTDSTSNPDVSDHKDVTGEVQLGDFESLKAERERYKRELEEADSKIEKLSSEVKLLEAELENKKKEIENKHAEPSLKIGGRDIEEVIEEKNRMIKSLEDELSRLEREHEDALQRLDDSSQQREAPEEAEDAGEIPYDVLDRLDDELAGAKQELSLKIEELKMCQENESSLRKRLDEALEWKEQALASQQDLTAARNALASKEKEIEEERQIRRAIEARYDEKLKLKVGSFPVE
jgi:hypothetical protein